MPINDDYLVIKGWKFYLAILVVFIEENWAGYGETIRGAKRAWCVFDWDLFLNKVKAVLLAGSAPTFGCRMYLKKNLLLKKSQKRLEGCWLKHSSA